MATAGKTGVGLMAPAGATPTGVLVNPVVDMAMDHVFISTGMVDKATGLTLTVTIRIHTSAA